MQFSKKGDSSNCPLCNSTNSSSNGSDPVYDSGKEKGFLISSVVMVVLALAGGYTCFFGVKERLGMFQYHSLSLLTCAPDRALNHLSFWQGFKIVVKSRTYLILLGSFLWVWMSNAVNQTNYLLYLKYVVHRENLVDLLLVRTHASSWVSLMACRPHC